MRRLPSFPAQREAGGALDCAGPALLALALSTAAVTHCGASKPERPNPDNSGPKLGVYFRRGKRSRTPVISSELIQYYESLVGRQKAMPEEETPILRV